MAEGLPYVRSFRELVVYGKARQLSQSIFQLSRHFPREEAYSLTDQIRRASRSVGANIAESWGKRGYERHFVSKLTDADSEQLETQHWLEVATDCGYLTREQVQPLLRACEEIGRLLGGMIARSDAFCNPAALREPPPAYLTSLPDESSSTEISSFSLPSTDY